MISSATSSADRSSRPTRRSVLALSALAGAGAVLAGCGMPGKGGAASGKDSGSAASARAAVAASTGPHGGVVLDTEYKGAPLTVEVGPVAVKDKYSVARFHISSDSEEAVYLSQAFAIGTNVSTTADVRMMSLERSVVYPELARNNEDLGGSVSKGKPVEAFPVFAALSDDVRSVEMLLPNMGVVIGIPVVAASDVDLDIADVIAKAKIDESDPGPFELERAAVSMDGSSDTKQDETSTTVTVAGDVTFATDSDQLSAQADAVLAGAVEQIEKHPSGGELTITGHTDDVADDAHNQDLSERRAEAVSERLKELTDLSKWNQSVSGEGESSPRVPNDSDERRQANRRVEITLTPSKPAEAGASPSASAAPPPAATPDPAGPVGKGPEGVDVTVEGKTVHMSIDHVVRVGEYVTGKVVLTSDEKVYVPVSSFALPGKLMELRGLSGVYGVSSLTILSGGLRHLEADYAYSDGRRFPLANNFVYDLEPGASQSFPVVWPDVGEDSIMIDIPEGKYRYARERIIARLTDVPVIDA